MCVPDSSYKHDQNHSVLQMPLESPLAVFLFSLSRALSLQNENKNKKMSNSSLSKIYESVFEIFWDEGFIARNTVKTGQYLCSAVTFRKRSAIEMQFRDFFPNWDQASKKPYCN